jgi:hypothetical protein
MHLLGNRRNPDFCLIEAVFDILEVVQMVSLHARIFAVDELFVENHASLRISQEVVEVAKREVVRATLDVRRRMVDLPMVILQKPWEIDGFADFNFVRSGIS